MDLQQQTGRLPDSSDTSLPSSLGPPPDSDAADNALTQSLSKDLPTLTPAQPVTLPGSAPSLVPGDRYAQQLEQQLGVKWADLDPETKLHLAVTKARADAQAQQQFRDQLTMPTLQQSMTETATHQQSIKAQIEQTIQDLSAKPPKPETGQSTTAEMIAMLAGHLLSAHNPFAGAAISNAGEKIADDRAKQDNDYNNLQWEANRQLMMSKLNDLYGQHKASEAEGNTLTNLGVERDSRLQELQKQSELATQQFNVTRGYQNDLNRYSNPKTPDSEKMRIGRSILGKSDPEIQNDILQAKYGERDKLINAWRQNLEGVEKRGYVSDADLPGLAAQRDGFVRQLQDLGFTKPEDAAALRMPTSFKSEKAMQDAIRNKEWDSMYKLKSDKQTADLKAEQDRLSDMRARTREMYYRGDIQGYNAAINAYRAAQPHFAGQVAMRLNQATIDYQVASTEANGVTGKNQFGRVDKMAQQKLDKAAAAKQRLDFWRKQSDDVTSDPTADIEAPGGGTPTLASIMQMIQGSQAQNSAAGAALPAPGADGNISGNIVSDKNAKGLPVYKGKDATGSGEQPLYNPFVKSMGLAPVQSGPPAGFKMTKKPK